MAGYVDRGVPGCFEAFNPGQLQNPVYTVSEAQFGCGQADCTQIGLQKLWLTGLVVSSLTRDQTMSPALAGEFLTSGPPGKYIIWILNSRLVVRELTACSGERSVCR